MKEDEDVKRVNPTWSTSRNLLVFSGNQCAFEGCTNKIVNDSGNYIAQVCHIEAAKPGGQRFNPDMTNEERSSYENLLILCYEHHVETNDIEKYTVSVLKEMKEKHERKFKNLVEDLSFEIYKDITEENSSTYPKTLNSLSKNLKWYLKEEDLKEEVQLAVNALDRLIPLPPSTRSVFLHMIKRASGGYDDNVIILEEVRNVLRIKIEDYYTHLTLLQKYKLISEPDVEEDSFSHTSQLLSVGDWIRFWTDLKDYSKISEIDLEELIVNMRFDLLD